MSTDAAVPPRRFDVGVIGGGSSAEALCRELSGGTTSIVVFEPALVGGECPFEACMPSKSMMHDAKNGALWGDAVDRRDEVVDHRDDSQHAAELTDLGVTLVRARARMSDAHTIRADGTDYEVEHIVVATGSSARSLDVPGTESCADLIWTSADAMTTRERPDRLLVVGAGVIGVECSTIFAGLGSDVVLVHRGEQILGVAACEVGDVLLGALKRSGVEVRTQCEVESVQRNGDLIAARLTDGTTIEADRMLVAIGRTPNTTGIGLGTVGIDETEPLPREPNGSLRSDGSLWAMGDVSGHGEYTHLANHHAAVIADHIDGTRTRRFDDVTQVGCVFTDPPVLQVGPGWSELDGDDDIVIAGQSLDSFPRAMTDLLDAGHLLVAARRSTGCLVAASGIGPSFDELVHALVVAVDGAVPVARLRLSMQPFPTIGEILGPIFDDLHRQLTTETAASRG